MVGITESIFTVILSVEFIIGILGNGFIALVNGVDLVRRRKISPIDKILTALAVSRISLLWLILLAWWLSVFHPALLGTRAIFRIIFTPLRVSGHLSSWLATCLIIFYFFKIANFSNSVFLYLKWRVKRVVSATLVVSLILLFSNTVVMNTPINTWVDWSKGNMSDSFGLGMVVKYSKFILLSHSVFMFIPFAVSLTTLLLLIFSLWRHLKTMQRSVPGCRDASTTAHVKALQAVVAFLLLYTIFFLSFLGKVWSLESVGKSPIILLAWATEMIFPSIHSCVLILGDSKLRQASVLLLWRLRGRSNDAGSSDS